MKVRKVAAAGRAKTRVAAYCRVSTRREEQEESLETQKNYYEKLIRRTEGWELASVYSDEKSGLRAEKRAGFQQMIHDAQEGKIDLILCKSVSRFSRNAAECQRYAELLLRRNVPVSFEKEHLKTSDAAGGFVFSMMSAVAQDESRSISENIQWANRQRVRRGEYNLGNNRILGYDCVDGTLVPNQDAWIVRMIFRLFLEGKSYRQIADAVAGAGGHCLRSEKTLNAGTIFRILRNETYVGDKLLQKHPPRNYLTKKPDFNAEYFSNYLTNDHEPVICRETWDEVQRKLRERERQRKEKLAD